MTVRTFYAQYEAHQKATKKEGTISSRLSLIRRYLLPSFGDRELDVIKDTNIAWITQQMKQAGLAEGTIKTAHSAFSSFFRLAVDKDLISVSPVHLQQKKLAKKPSPQKSLSAENRPANRLAKALHKASCEPADHTPTSVNPPVHTAFMTPYSSFETVAIAFLKERSIHTLDPDNYFKRHLEMLKRHVFPCFSSKAIADITKDEILYIISNDNIPENISFKRYQVFLKVHEIFRYARANNLILENPCAEIHCTYKQKNNDFIQFTDEECRCLLDAFEHVRLNALYRFSYITGLPIATSAVLGRGQVDLTTGHTLITKRLSIKYADRSFPYDVKERSITLPREGINILQDLSDDCSTYYFYGAEDFRISSVIMAQDAAVIRDVSGISNFRFRHLTENYVMRCLNAGVDIASLENYLGYRPNAVIMRVYGNSQGILLDPVPRNFRERKIR